MANTDKWLPLFNAAKIGDEETIKSLLAKEEVDIKMQISGETALHVAAYNGHENVVTLLCKNKELLYLRDEKGHTPLFIAVSKGHVQIVETLCQNGSRVNDRDRERNTPLLIAVHENRPEIVTSLLNHKANPNVDRCSKISPFQVALQKNYKPIVQLLQHSTNLLDICSCPSYPEPELAEKIFNRCLGMRFVGDYLSGKKKRNCKSALHFAASYGRIGQVKRLIESGAKVNVQATGNSVTPLHQAVSERHISVVEYLLSKMADVNAVDSGGNTPLHYASQNKSCHPDFQQKDFEDSLKIMEILLKNGASVDVFSNNAKTPLHYAVEEKVFRPEKIRLLLEYKANVNAYHVSGDRTPIFFVKCGAILQMLIDKGMDVNFRNLKGSYTTRLHQAIDENDITKVDILLENGADVNVPIRSILSDQDQRSIVDVLKAEPEINEAIIDRMMDITPAINTLFKDRSDYCNIIPILVKRHFHGEVTINSEEFSSASGIFFSKFKECQEELEKMRDVNVLNLSLFDILVMPIKKLSSYAMKEKILKIFEPETIQDKFPVYSGMIMRRFKRAKERRDLIDSSSEALKKFIFSLHKIYLPDLVVYEIINLLHVVDWKNLVEV